MKKFLSVLLIVSMLMTFTTVVFSGTVTALAADTGADVVAAVYDGANDGSGNTFAEILNALVKVVKAIWEYISSIGGLAAILDSFYDFLGSIGIDIDGFYDWIQTSGIVDVIVKIFF